MPHVRIVIIGVAVLALDSGVRCQESQQRSPGKTPPYPRVDLAPRYEVDPSWPHKPAGFDWKDMPGIAVDARDNVWLFTRATPPVQVYKADGTFVRAWGQENVGLAHHLKIDRDGKIWLADIGLHVVRQFTPEGKLLRTLGTPGVPGEDEHHFDKPTDMVLTPSGEVFVTDGYGNNRVVTSTATASSCASGVSSASDRPTSACRTPSHSTPRAGSTSPTATTFGSRSTTRGAGCLIVGAT